MVLTGIEHKFGLATLLNDGLAHLQTAQVDICVFPSAEESPGDLR
jgi:hypothetical protein